MNQKTASAPAAENKMGTMPIGRLLFNMSLPMMVSMLVQALYNIVDSIFVAKLSWGLQVLPWLRSSDSVSEHLFHLHVIINSTRM